MRGGHGREDVRMVSRKRGTELQRSVSRKDIAKITIYFCTEVQLEIECYFPC